MTSQSPKPILTFCVAIYNVSKYLGECLDSLLSIKDQDIEFIMVNDGSTDNSLTICEKYLEADKRFRLSSHTENKSLIQARKTGIELARGKYLCFLDGDDKVESKNITQLISSLKNTENDIVQFGVSCFGEEQFIPQNFNVKFKLKTEKNDLSIKQVRFEVFHTHSISWQVFNKVYKTNLLRRCLPALENVSFTSGEDAYLTFILTHLAQSYSSLDVPIYRYRIGTGISNGAETIEKFSVHVRDISIPRLLNTKLSTSIQIPFDLLLLTQLEKALKELTVLRFWRLPLLDKKKGYQLMKDEGIKIGDLLKFSIQIFIKFSSRVFFPVGSKRSTTMKKILIKCQRDHLRSK